MQGPTRRRLVHAGDVCIAPSEIEWGSKRTGDGLLELGLPKLDARWGRELVFFVGEEVDDGVGSAVRRGRRRGWRRGGRATQGQGRGGADCNLAPVAAHAAVPTGGGATALTLLLGAILGHHWCLVGVAPSEQRVRPGAPAPAAVVVVIVVPTAASTLQAVAAGGGTAGGWRRPCPSSTCLVHVPG